MNLYQITAQFQHDAAKLADLDLDDATLADTLESLSGNFEEKATNTIMVSRNLGATSQAIKDAAAAMLERARAIDNRVDALKKRVFEAMNATGITRIECPWFVLSIANNPPAVDVFDSLQVPADYMREIPATYAPDKALIKKALQEGFDVPGAKIVQNTRLKIA
jgi:hypothetical protein